MRWPWRSRRAEADAGPRGAARSRGDAAWRGLPPLPPTVGLTAPVLIPPTLPEIATTRPMIAPPRPVAGSAPVGRVVGLTSVRQRWVDPAPLPMPAARVRWAPPVVDHE